ncbi:hypothetical protein IH781_02315 [Patescibacteria group bacterium]|nr:hypothetical protein [Patescibacteria group bacterium]
MQNGARRLITSPAVLNAMGYTSIHLRGEYPSLYTKYAQGQPISAFKGVNPSGTASKGAPVAAPNTASNLTKVRPAIRTLIGQVNELYRLAYDKDPTISENKFWVDYLYNGELTTKTDLLAKMRSANEAGGKPARTSRTSRLAEEVLEQKWFSYLFYFVHQAEPDAAARAYWFSRIRPGDRDSIEKLGGTLQWLKDTQGLRYK